MNSVLVNLYKELRSAAEQSQEDGEWGGPCDGRVHARALARAYNLAAQRLREVLEESGVDVEQELRLLEEA